MCITLVRKLQYFINPKQPFPAIGEREGWRKPVYSAKPSTAGEQVSYTEWLETRSEPKASLRW